MNTTKAATETRITGRDARTATGTTNRGERVRFTVGQRVGMSVIRPCDDGGELSGYRYGTITRIAVGTEYGMHGTTALAMVRFEKHYGEAAHDALIPVRYLNPEQPRA